jgi:hypothetical protein
LISHKQSNLFTTADQLAQDLEPFLARAGADDPVAIAKALAQIARDRGENHLLVIYDDDRWASATGLSHVAHRALWSRHTVFW